MSPDTTYYFDFVERLAAGGHVQVKLCVSTDPNPTHCAGGFVLGWEAWEALRPWLEHARQPRGLDVVVRVKETPR